MRGNSGLRFPLNTGSVCKSHQLKVIINFEGNLEYYFKNCVTASAMERVE